MRSRCNQPGGDGRFDIYDRGLPYNRVGNMPVSWEPSDKENKDLCRFDATISSYTEWVQSIFDHLSRTNRGCPQLLRHIEQKDKPIVYEELSRQPIGGVTPWDIACNLETLLAAWLLKSLKQRRLALCGNQTRTGLEMWRQLHQEFKGTGDLIDASGMKLLTCFPRCRSLEHLSAHLDQWTQLVGQ